MNIGLHAKVDKDIKDKALEILGGKGVTLSEYIRQALVRLVEDKEIPFTMNIPNDETVAALKESVDIGRRLEAKYKGVLFDVKS